MSDIDHDHDDQGNCIPPQGDGGDSYAQQQPNWRFSLWDIAAISTSFVGSVAGSIGSIGINLNTAMNMLAREFGAAANFSRQTKELEEAQRLNERARRQMSAGLERMLRGGDDL